MIANLASTQDQKYVFNLRSTMFCCFAVGKLLPSNNNRKGSLYRKLKLQQTPHIDKYEVSLGLHATHDDGHKLNATSYIQTKSVRTRASRLLLTLTRIIMLRSKYTQKYHSTSSSRNSFFGDEQFFKTLVFLKKKIKSITYILLLSSLSPMITRGASAKLIVSAFFIFNYKYASRTM